jgi:hypothetical protein
MITKEEVFSNMVIKQDAGVPFNRTNPVPLDKHSIFASKSDAVSYATLSATAYPGQVIAVNEDELANWSTRYESAEQIELNIPSFELSFENSDWHVKFSNGYETSTGLSGFRRYDASTSSWLTGDYSANDLSLCLVEHDGNLQIPTTASQIEVSVYFSRSEVNTWNLYVIDPSSPNNLKKIEGGSSSSSGGSSGDVEAETARAIAAELALSNSITALTLSTDQISNAVEGLTGTLDNYQPVSSMTAYQQVSDMTAYQQVSDMNDYQMTSDMTAYQMTSDMTAYVKHDDLSDANAGGLSNATAENPIMLSSDLSALVTKAIVLQGVVSTSADLADKTDAKVGDMWIAADTGAEYVYANPDGETLADKWQELGREGTIAELARYIADLSGENGQIAYLSNAITANADNISTLSNTTIPTLCTDLSNAITANADNISTLSTQLSTVSGDLDTAKTKIDELTADVNTLSNTTIPELCGNITSVSGDLTSISSDIYTDGTGLSAQVTSIASTV